MLIFRHSVAFHYLKTYVVHFCCIYVPFGWSTEFSLRMIMEPGWSPLPGDPHPFFQVDFLEPTWISGVVTQGSERMWGYLTKYRLAFALEDNHFTNFTETRERGSPLKVIPSETTDKNDESQLGT